MRTRAIIALLALIPFTAGAWQDETSGYHISIIDGEGALNNVQGRLAREPIIQVEDRNHNRVPGAYVTFDTPQSGPSSLFADGTNHFAMTTGADGRAAVSGMRNNGIHGSYNIDVHVSVNGHEVGHVTIHQTNVPPRVNQLSNNLEDSKVAKSGEVAVGAGVVGVAVGSEFTLNGAPGHENANLQNGSQVDTGGTPAAVYLHDHSEFLVGPNSGVLIGEPNLLTVESGAARAREFGNWKMGHGGVSVLGASPDADGVLVVSKTKLEIADISGTINIVDSDGKVIKTLGPGTVYVFPITGAVSGAGVATVGISEGHIWAIGAGAAALLIGVGVGVEVSTPKPPTSQ